MSIVSRRGNEEHNQVSLIVASFQDDSSCDGLNVAKPSFSIDHHAPI